MNKKIRTTLLMAAMAGSLQERPAQAEPFAIAALVIISAGKLYFNYEHMRHYYPNGSPAKMALVKTGVDGIVYPGTLFFSAPIFYDRNSESLSTISQSDHPAVHIGQLTLSASVTLGLTEKLSELTTYLISKKLGYTASESEEERRPKRYGCLLGCFTCCRKS